MKVGYTHISFLLDKSGSMHKISDDTIGGFNNFLAEQQREPGEATFSFVQFDHEYDERLRMQPLRAVQALTPVSYRPGGSTALYDCAIRMIDDTGRVLAQLPESERPEKVIFAILTDGEENASSTHAGPAGMKRVNERITRQQHDYKWQFVFLGANQDAMATATQFNIPVVNTVTFAANSVGTQTVMRSFSKNMSDYRMGAKANMDFATSDYAAQTAAGVDSACNDVNAHLQQQQKQNSAG